MRTILVPCLAALVIPSLIAAAQEPAEFPATDATRATPQLFDAAPPVEITDAISREVSVFRPYSVAVPTDAISREVSVYAPIVLPPGMNDAISREVSVFKPIPEVELTDAISREVSTFSVIPITLGAPYEGVLAPGTYLFFRVTTPSDLTLRIDLDHASTTAWTELYASFGHVPDTYNAEFSSESPSQPDQELIVPNTQAGTYFILVRSTTDSNAGASKSFSLLAQASLFGLDFVRPATVGAGVATIAFRGARFSPTTAFSLVCPANGAAFNPVSTALVDAARARVTFDLTGVAPGQCDVTISAPDGRHAELASGLQVDLPNEITEDIVAVSVVGVPGIRHGGTGPGTITLKNTANVDAPITRVIFTTLYDPQTTITVGAAPGIMLAGTTEYRWAESWFENIRPGESVDVPFAIKLGLDPAVDPVPLYVQQTVFTREQFRTGFLQRIIDDELEIIRQQQHDWEPAFVSTFVPEYRRLRTEAFDAGGLPGLKLPSVDPRLQGSDVVTASVQISCGTKCAAVATACVPACLATGALVLFCETVVCGGGGLLCLVCCENPCLLACDPLQVRCPDRDRCHPPCDYGGTCPQQCTEHHVPNCLQVCGDTPWGRFCDLPCSYWTCDPGTCFDGPLVWDPNEKFTTLGFGDQQYVPGADEISYEISFENLPEAQAPAAIVKISDPIDPALDPSTFRIGRIYFGSTTIDVPPNRGSLKSRVDLLSTYGVLVDISAGIDTVNNTAWWDILALDPETMQVPANAYVGFLPPENGTGRGQGGVSFSIAPRTDQPSGTLVHNTASIVFDYNDPIATNEVSNMIDAGAPQTAVQALVAATATPFVVRWSGQDDTAGSGLVKVDVYVSVAGGAPTLWRSTVGAGWDYYHGEVGKQYSFHAIGTDNVKNVESPPATPDATTGVSHARRQGDVDYDGDTDKTDFRTLVECWWNLPSHNFLGGPDHDVPSSCAETDFTADHRVDLADFAALQIRFGTPQ